MKQDKNIRELDSNQIYTLLFPLISQIYKSYKFLNLSKTEFSQLVLQEIEYSKITSINHNHYKEYLKKRIKMCLSEIAKQRINNPTTVFNLLDNYINQNFVPLNNNYQNAQKNFKMLSAFLASYDYIPNSDLIINLINNNNYFKQTIKLIVKKYKLLSETGVSQELFEDSLFLLVIHVYDTLNKIEIDESENSYEDVDTSEDLLRIYLNEISQKPMLTAQQELELSQKIQEGDLLAKKKFIEANLKLVVSIAKNLQIKVCLY